MRQVTCVLALPDGVEVFRLVDEHELSPQHLDIPPPGQCNMGTMEITLRGLRSHSPSRPGAIMLEHGKASRTGTWCYPPHAALIDVFLEC